MNLTRHLSICTHTSTIMARKLHDHEKTFNIISKTDARKYAFLKSPSVVPLQFLKIPSIFRDLHALGHRIPAKKTRRSFSTHSPWTNAESFRDGHTRNEPRKGRNAYVSRNKKTRAHKNTRHLSSNRTVGSVFLFVLSQYV